ncbi:hypothetical protein PYW08_006154 [Mythimna loreyi]|uniref:Uncharacterized protein n=1 Tax=Mythimna loreyi TaxID=667449 RepID=A0ACC2QPE0_9NEOP|nr:hypothetical protein PYW08_006154 [Mythimna loreyi]
MQSRRGRSRTTATRRNLQQHGHGHTWKNIPFTNKPHDYTTTLPKNPVRTLSEYLHDYFVEGFYEETARCTNLYYMSRTGQELKTTKAEIAKMFGVHILMGYSILQISSSPLSDIIPFPKSTQKRSFNRKHKKSEVISSSP